MSIRKSDVTRHRIESETLSEDSYIFSPNFKKVHKNLKQRPQPHDYDTHEKFMKATEIFFMLKDIPKTIAKCNVSLTLYNSFLKTSEKNQDDEQIVKIKKEIYSLTNAIKFLEEYSQTS
jgi:predicted nucleotidyltransferase